MVRPIKSASVAEALTVPSGGGEAEAPSVATRVEPASALGAARAADDVAAAVFDDAAEVDAAASASAVAVAALIAPAAPVALPVPVTDRVALAGSGSPAAGVEGTHAVKTSIDKLRRSGTE